MIKSITVCEFTDVLSYAESNKLADWNEFHDLVWNCYNKEHNEKYKHRHFYLNSFIVTKNWFNEEYMDDAYGLKWHPIVRKAVEGFMKKHKLDKVMFLTCNNHSLMVL